MMFIALARFSLLTLCALALGRVQAAPVDLNDGWSFYRADNRTVSTAQQVPAGAWTTVSLPHAARLEPRVPTAPWQGTAFYKKQLQVALRPGQRAILRFEAVMNVADVWVNGKHLGQHLGGYLPFAFDITDALKPHGANELVVRANNDDNPVTGPKPLKDLDYIQHGGIYRSVNLSIKPAVHIVDELLSDTPGGGGVFVTYPRADQEAATVQVQAEVGNTSSRAQTVTLRHALAWQGAEVAHVQQQVRLAAGERRHVTVTLALRAPRLWSPRTPHLYDLTTTVRSAGAVDTVLNRIGVRRLAFEGGKLLLNGAPLQLRGVNRHQEYPYVGYALSPQADYRDALLIKKYGFDYVRLSHYPQSPAFMAAADALGLMVLPGIPGWQFHNPDPAFARQVVRTCADMIRRDRNHPSVLAWECSLNETAMPDVLRESLHRTVHAEYPGDQAWSAGWVPQPYDIYLQARQHRLGSKRALPDKPLIVSEYGDWEYFAGNAGLNQTAWADLKPAARSSRQALGQGEARLLQQAANVAEAHADNATTPAFADGYWVMFDYARGYAPDLEESGAMSIERLPKFAAEYFRSQRDPAEQSPQWGGGPMVFIASYWQPDSAPRVRVFSNADAVELRLNGRLVGRQAGKPGHPPMEFDTGGFVPGELVATAYLEGRVVAEHRVRTPGAPVTLTVAVDDLGVPSTPGDLVFARARLVDANGTTVPVSGQQVTFAGADIVGSASVATEAGIASVLVRAGARPPVLTARVEPTIRNGVFWKDTTGTPIYSQGGGMLKIGAKYYWYGVKYAEAVTYAAAPGKFSPNPHFGAVTTYSSTDLVNWTFEGDVLTPAGLKEHADPKAWLGRMGVVYNKVTRKYVLVIQYGGAKGAGVLFATSDTPTGPFTFNRLQATIDNVASPTSGDQTLFVDDDGQPYLIFSNNGDRRQLYVAPLRTSDFLHVEPATNIYRAPGGGREGNAMFKYQGLYYFLSSDLHGWNASRSYYMTAPRITGPYSPEKRLAGTDADFSHVSQNGFFIPVQGTSGTTVIYAGDRWSDFAGNGLGYNVWVPLSFNGAEPVFNSLSSWTLDAAAGTWRTGADNNYVRNPGFEADRIGQSNVAGWVTSWTSIGGTAPVVNTQDGHTGRWALTLRHPGKSMGSAVQDIVLPNGVYTLKAWVKSSGGQGVAKLYASGHGGAEHTLALDRRIDNWTEVTQTGIRVDTGTVQIGVYTEGKEGDWVALDDVSLVRE